MTEKKPDADRLPTLHDVVKPGPLKPIGGERERELHRLIEETVSRQLQEAQDQIVRRVFDELRQRLNSKSENGGSENPRKR